MQETKRATIYFDPAIHHALRIKAADLHCSISEIVNQALRQALGRRHHDRVSRHRSVPSPL